MAERLGLADDQWQLAFQSLFGREEWLRPYTSDTLKAWGEQGLKNVHVICPGFAADCLETLDEIAVENRHVFTGAGGGDFHYIPALNADAAHVAALSEIARTHIGDWAVEKDAWDAAAAEAEGRACKARAEAMRQPG